MVCLACTLTSQIALAAEPVDAASAARFGDVLLAADDPFNALTWYRLAGFLEPERDEGALRFRIALCYERGERWDAAAQAWLDVAGRDPALSPQATYRAAMVMATAGRFEEARFRLGEVVAEGEGTPWADRARYVDPVLHLAAYDVDPARAGFDAFLLAEPDSAYAARALAVRAVLEAKARRRSPALAGAFSVLVPGAGQLYAGHEGDAVMTFIATGGMSFLTYALLRQGIEDDRAWEVSAGGIVGGMALVTWSANVLGAVQGAQRTNRLHDRRLAEEALREADDRSLERDARDVELPALSAPGPAAAP